MAWFRPLAFAASGEPRPKSCLTTSRRAGSPGIAARILLEGRVVEHDHAVDLVAGIGCVTGAARNSDDAIRRCRRDEFVVIIAIEKAPRPDGNANGRQDVVERKDH